MNMMVNDGAKVKRDIRSNMLIGTSLMYSEDEWEIEKQTKAMQTWKDAGFDVISCNVEEEIEPLQKVFPQVTFVKLVRSGKEKTGKPFPFIYDILWALENNIVEDNEVCGIVNSDIFIRNLSASVIKDYLIKHEDTILFLHRYDIEDELDVEGEYYFSGVDAFFFLVKHLEKFPDRGFMLGRPEWDHWFLYEATKAGLQVREIKNKIAFHIKHRQRWTPAESNKMATDNVGKKDSDYLDEQYYFQTNMLMADLSCRLLFNEGIKQNDVDVIKQDGYYCDADRQSLLDWGKKSYGDQDISESVGVVFFKNDKAYRICALHCELENGKNGKFTLGQILPNERGKGCILKYIDFRDFDFVSNLGRVYVYPAGRASRLLIDCMNTYQIPVLGMVDRDAALWGTKYRDSEIFDLSVLENEKSYDHVLIATNLYVREIYEALSKTVDREKLIVL